MDPFTIAALLAAADVAGEAIPTAAEKQAGDEIKEFELLEEEGRLGELSSEEEAVFGERLAVGKKAAEEMGAKMGAAISATGDRTGGQALEVGKGITEAASAAAQDVDQKRQEAQLLKIGEREEAYDKAIAVKSKQQEELIESVVGQEGAAGALGAHLGGTGGMAEGTAQIPGMSPEAMKALQGMNPEQLSALSAFLGVGI